MKVLLVAFIRAYQLLFSPWLGGVCRFTPSCSAYALVCMERHGAGWGSYLTLRRLLRCQPWCEGGHDPAPEVRPALRPALRKLFTPLLEAHCPMPCSASKPRTPEKLL